MRSGNVAYPIEEWFTCLLTARQYWEVVFPLFPRKSGMAHFLPSRYKFCKLYECRGTRLIGAANLSPVTKLVTGTGPEYSGVQSVSEPEICHSAGFKLRADARTLSGAKGGCKNHYKFVLGAGAKAKTVTTCPETSGNNLPILSVLCVGFI